MSKLLLVALVCCTGSYAAVTRTFDVTTIIQSRFAQTTMESIVYNNKNTDSEVTFQSILPREAYITSFSMQIDGKWYDGTIEEKEEAEKIFKALTAKNKTAGIVRTRDETIKTFKTSVNVGARKEVTFKLVYNQLLRRHQGKYKNRIILLGNQFSERLNINVYICESTRITNATVLPSITSTGTKVSPDVNIVKEDNFVHVEYLPANSNDPVVRALSREGGSFTVEYSTDVVGAGDIVVDKQYFMHFFNPNAADAPDAERKEKNRRIMFVLDTSGSMGGNKIEQMKEAMIAIIEGFVESDRFGVMEFNTKPKSWTYKGSKISAATEEAIADAKTFISDLRAGGGTNILASLKDAMDIVNKDLGAEVISADPATNYIVFLTDGQGNGPAEYVLHAMERGNTKGIAIHAIGLGNGVNSDFLKQLAAQNYGTWRQILADTSATLQIQDYLMELGFTIIDGGLSITYPPIVKETIMTDRTRMPEGGELVTFGKFKKSGKFSPSSHVINVDQSRKETLNLTFTLTQTQPTCSAVGFKALKNYGEQAFGIMRVENVLKRMDAAVTDGTKKDLKQEAIKLSIKYKLVTPVTAMLVVKPEDLAALEAEEKAKEAERLRKEQEAKDKLKEKGADDNEDDSVIDTTTHPTTDTTPQPTTSSDTTKSANDTEPWWSTNGDPHFVVHLSNNITSCFNWFGEDGDIYNLLTDTKNEVVINGQLKKSDPSTHSLFIHTIAILSLRHNVAVMVEPRSVLVRDFTVEDKRMRDLQIPVMDTHSFETTVGRIRIAVSAVNKAHTILNVTIDNAVSFTINLHHFEEYSSDHLDFVIPHTGGFADDLTGIFGSFPKEARHGQALASLDSIGQKHLLWFHNRLIAVEQRSMEIPTISRRVSCWFVSNAEDILGHPPSYFQLNRIYDVPVYNDDYDV